MKHFYLSCGLNKNFKNVEILITIEPSTVVYAVYLCVATFNIVRNTHPVAPLFVYTTLFIPRYMLALHFNLFKFTFAESSKLRTQFRLQYYMGDD